MRPVRDRHRGGPHLHHEGAGLSLWVFGYGSLVFRPDFPFLEAAPARVVGWRRVWWQGSTDHRGTPDRPGRVVTLVAEPGATVTGMAYRVDEAVAAPVVAGLDHREKGGYDQHRFELLLADRAIRDVLVYVAGADNPNFLGPDHPEAMARQIATSEGPSGRNSDYLLRLEAALRELGGDDEETFQLAARVRGLLAG